MTKENSLFGRKNISNYYKHRGKDEQKLPVYNVGRNSIQPSLSSSIIRIRNEDKFEREIITPKALSSSSNDRCDWYKNTENSGWNKHCYCSCLNHDWHSMHYQHSDCIDYWYSCSCSAMGYYCWAPIGRGSYYCLHMDWNLNRIDYYCCCSYSEWDYRNLCSLNLDCYSLDNPVEDLMENRWKNLVNLRRRKVWTIE